MGLYDSVIFSCPRCSAPHGFQSKALMPSLREFSPERVPREIAEDIDGQEEYCQGCGALLKVGPDPNREYWSMEVHIIEEP